MKTRTKKLLFLLTIMSLALIIYGCGGENVAVIEEYAGSGGPGDFYRVTINITGRTYSYSNLTTGDDSGTGTFSPVSVSGNSGVYRLDTGDLFVKYKDELIVVANSDSNPGERITVGLKTAEGNYGSEIEGTYNLVTSMEGATGEVEIDAADETASIKLDMNGDGDYNDPEEQLPGLSYSFYNTYKAIELIESEEFKHYGVFVSDDISVWDSYYWNGENWQGDGMSVMLRQNTDLDLSDIEGKYDYIDVDGYSGNYELVAAGTGENEFNLMVDGQPTGVNITESNIDQRGFICFTADPVEPEGEMENWYMMVLPGKTMIIASADENTFFGDGGFAIGVKR